MLLKERIHNNELLLLDGSMGAVLIGMGFGGNKTHRINIEKPEIITEIHKEYFSAGCDIILTNTFNITPESMQKANMTVKETVRSAVIAASKARECYPDKYIALNLGPTGKLMEPYGQHPYESAYDYFALQIKEAHENVDLFVIETISDINEMRAAIQACRDICKKPILAAMTFTSRLKTWLGFPLEEWAEFINHSDIDAGGINCTLTPAEMLPLALELKSKINKPLFAEPNRGQPETDGEHTIYRMSPDTFAEGLYAFYRNGIHILGGCCGSDPTCMQQLRKKLS
ncbi:MAG: homocysteine S-methyltransferase family protein [Anaerofustis sp.]